MIKSPVLGLLLAFQYARAADSCATVCNSYGLDFEDGGTYFQNIASSSNFTASEDFTGCAQDYADNVLVDPSGNQYLCNTTPMTPDSTPQEVTCPIMKNQLTSGTWSIIVLSNNGACDPIDYIRSFSLNVGVQATQTDPLTVSVTSTSAPVTTETVATTAWVTSTAQTVTTTVSGSYAATKTITPAPKTVYTTRGLIEVTKQSIVPTIVATRTTQAACPKFAASKSHAADRKNTKAAVTVPGLRATVGLSANLGLRHVVSTPTARSGSLEHKRELLARRRSDARLDKRAPDSATVTIQDGAAGTSISTIVVTAPMTTTTVTSTVLSTAYATATVTADLNAYKTATTTIPAKTVTRTIWLPLYTTTWTSTQPVTATITAIASCK